MHMCERYAAYNLKKIIDFLGISNCDDLDNFKDNHNASPGQILPVITCKSPHKISLFKWGLIPPWYKTGITAENMFNVEAGRISRRPVLRGLLNSQRCIVLTSGYYEGRIIDGLQQSHLVKVKGEPFTLLAGLFESSQDKRTGEITDSFTVITTQASAQLSALYPSMPLTLTGEDQSDWLSLASTDEKIGKILFHDARHEVELFPVPVQTIDPRSNLPGLIMEIE